MNAPKDPEPSSQPSPGPRSDNAKPTDAGAADMGQTKATTAPFEAKSAARDKAAPPKAVTAHLAGARNVAAVAVTALVAALIGGLVVALWPRPVADDAELAAADPAVASRIIELNDALAAARDDIDALKSGLADQRREMTAIGDRVPDTIGDTVDELDDRLQGLEQAVASLSGVAAPADGQASNVITQLTGDVTALRAAIDGVKADTAGRLSALEAVAPPANLDERLLQLAAKSDVAALERRVVTLEQDQTSKDTKRAALALAVANLTRASETGAPFTAELNAVAILAPGRAVIVDLKSFAQNGLPTRAALTQEFADAIDDAMDAERLAGAQSWWQSAWARIVSLVTIRRTGDIEGDTTQAIIARTEVRLSEGDLGTASRELHKLKGAAAEKLAPFVVQLDAKIELDALISALMAEALAGLGQ